LKSFFWYCDHSDFLTKNPVVHLDPISVTRPKTEPFTHEQQIAIFNALPGFRMSMAGMDSPSPPRQKHSFMFSGTPAWR
jgi:hypothetical protein